MACSILVAVLSYESSASRALGLDAVVSEAQGASLVLDRRTETRPASDKEAPSNGPVQQLPRHAPSLGGSTTFFDERGTYQGKALTSRRETRLFGADGAYEGKAVEQNGVTDLYDERGAYAGRAMRFGGSIKYFDRTGRYIGEERSR